MVIPFVPPYGVVSMYHTPNGTRETSSASEGVGPRALMLGLIYFAKITVYLINCTTLFSAHQCNHELHKNVRQHDWS